MFIFPRRTPIPAASNDAEVVTDPVPSLGSGVEELVIACQQGDREAQRQLYDRCHARIFRLALRMVGSQDAPDLTQHIFLQLFRTICQFRAQARFETWLYRLAMNECLQHLRRQGRVQYDRLTDEAVDRMPDHARAMQHTELLELALKQLDPELRSIFVLREVDRMPYQEIAQVLQISEGTVASRLNRARAQLKQRLVQLGWEF